MKITRAVFSELFAFTCQWKGRPRGYGASGNVFIAGNVEIEEPERLLGGVTSGKA